MLIFDDESANDWNRQKVLEKLSQVSLPANLQPQIGPDYSPVGQIFFYTLRSTNPGYDVMDLKSLEDWVLDKQFKSVPNVVDVSSFGGITREYQVLLNPDKLISYGLSIGQIETQLSSNNVNAGGSFIEAGLQQVNVRALGLMTSAQDIEQTVVATKNGTSIFIRDVGTVVQGPKIRLGHFARVLHRADGRLLDNPDAVSGIVLLRKGAESDSTLEAIHAKVKELNEQILPPGVRIVSFLDRSDLVKYTTHTVLHNLTEGVILVSIILFLFLGNLRGAIIVALTIPFALLFASICLDLRHIPSNLLSLGALDFGMVVDGAVVMVENMVRHMGSRQDVAKTPLEKIREAAHEVQRPVFYAIGIIITAYLPIFTLQRVEGRLFKPMAWTVAFALLGALLFSMVLAPVLASFAFRKDAREWYNPIMTFLTAIYRRALMVAVRLRWITVGIAASGVAGAFLLSSSGLIGSEFLPHLDEGAIWVRGTMAPQYRAFRGNPNRGQDAHTARVLPGSDDCDQSSRQTRRWHRYHGLLQLRIFCGSEAQRALAASLP
jgi:cobalt-zinc-cadmium resistance protein CzcA